MTKAKEPSRSEIFGFVVGAAALAYAYMISLELLIYGLSLAEFARLGTDRGGPASPVVATAIGILSASIAQSSSLTTSIVAGAFASGTVDLSWGIHAVIGANIGTTLTAAVVTLRYARRTSEFERALRGALMHIAFNVVTAIPLVFLESRGRGLSSLILSWIQKHPSGAVHHPSHDATGFLGRPIGALADYLTDDLGYGAREAGVCLFLCGLVAMIVGLFGLVRMMRRYATETIERAMSSALMRGRTASFLAGIVVTVVMQSSTLSTSLMIPLFASGVLDQRRGFAMIAGANLGTTLKLVAAAYAGSQGSIEIAIAHLLFNALGASVLFALPYARRLVPGLASFGASFFRGRPFVFAALLVAIWLAGPLVVIAFL